MDGNSARPGRIALGLTALAAQRLIRHPGRATRAVLSSTIVARSGAEARALIRAAVDRALGWAGRTAAPRVIDIMLPHLEERVVPELIDAAMPLLHAKVVPAIIEDLIDSPLVRTLLLEQSRGVVSHTADQLRDATARADGRVEDAVHNLVRRSRGR